MAIYRTTCTTCKSSLKQANGFMLVSAPTKEKSLNDHADSKENQHNSYHTQSKVLDYRLKLGVFASLLHEICENSCWYHNSKQQGFH